MRDEVEEFLRRAAQRRAQAEAKRRSQQQPAPQAPPPQQRPAPIARPPLRQRMPTVDEPLVEIIDAEEADTSSRFNQSVSQHMRGSLDIARHASSLGAEVDQADDRLEARLHKTFDHQVGQLKDTTTAAAPRVVVAALPPLNIRKMLESPESIRNSFILGEVFARPEHRWD
jgi:hypothetical protein